MKTVSDIDTMLQDKSLDFINKSLWEEVKRLLPYYIKLDPEKIIIFGSLARNEAKETSDIDVQLIVKDKKDYYTYIEGLFDMGYNPVVPIDLVIDNEPSEEEKKEYTLFEKIENEGVTIYVRKQTQLDDEEQHEETILGKADV